MLVYFLRNRPVVAVLRYSYVTSGFQDLSDLLGRNEKARELAACDLGHSTRRVKEGSWSKGQVANPGLKPPYVNVANLSGRLGMWSHCQGSGSASLPSAFTTEGGCVPERTLPPPILQMRNEDLEIYIDEHFGSPSLTNCSLCFLQEPLTVRPPQDCEGFIGIFAVISPSHEESHPYQSLCSTLVHIKP